jgi:signal peptidase I
MLTTFLFFLVFGVSLSISLLLSAWLLRLGAKWAKVGGVSFKRAVLAALLIELVYLVVRGSVRAMVGLGFQSKFEQYPYAVPVTELVLSSLAAWAMVQWILGTTIRQAIVAWIPTLLANAVAWVLAFAIVRPFLFEAFVVPTNAMAPTIVGRHLRAACPSCGGVAYVSPSSVSTFSPGEDLGICGKCMRASNVSVTNARVFQGDQLIAGKFLHPQRWDPIVFRHPEDPSVTYVSRLVGLPGEELAIRDGEVWINGTRAQKPTEISALVYAADPFATGKTVWGPVKLGSEDYVVLSDFSRRAKDSRVWERGAPGHPTYAVPKSYVSGVVTHTYWPPARWRIFR